MVHGLKNDAAFQKPLCCVSTANEAPQDLNEAEASKKDTSDDVEVRICEDEFKSRYPSWTYSTLATSAELYLMNSSAVWTPTTMYFLGCWL